MSGAGPSLYPVEFPSRAVFQFPPDAAPPALPPPSPDHLSFRNPIPIPAHVYNAVLSPYVPLTIAAVYASTAVLLNAYNRSHGNKPWRISKTRLFHWFVILHNSGLAIYSAVTCWAMIRSLKHSIPHYTEPNAIVGTIDALCKIHGPRGLGDAVYYNTVTNQWQSKNPNIQLDAYGNPQSDDLGRVWNEGLAWWGWVFYLSKFYEVVDTLIIIMKGKRSTTLQTYHHAGAMLSMWSGIRYMSPPIWMFALVNSGIHAMMYTYYTVSALGVRVPQRIKRTLTTMQITQFLVGVTFAACHLFVSYTVPVTVAYHVKEKVLRQVNSTSVLSATPSPVSSTAVPVATGAALAFLKKWIYRAAGDEGLAENVYTPDTTPSPIAFPSAVQHAQHPIHDMQDRTYYRTQYEHIPCIDTSGQAFAIYLNLIYLAPLTLLFMRFFFKSYIRRTSPNTKHPTTKTVLAKSTRDAIHGVDREVESLGRSAEDGVSSAIMNGASALRGRSNGKVTTPVSTPPPKSSSKNAANGKANGEQQQRTSSSNSSRNGNLSPENKKFIDSLNLKVSRELERTGEDDEGSKERARRLAKEVFRRASLSASASVSTEASERGESPGESERKGSGGDDRDGYEEDLFG